MNKLYIYPYKMGSRSASNLADALDISQIKHERSKFRGRPSKTVINWGASELPIEVKKCRVLNNLEAVRIAGNKLRFFEHQSRNKEINLVPWTTSWEEANSWLVTGSTIVGRNSLTGHSGYGIIITEPGTALLKAPLYTKYVPKDSEYRIHCMKGEIIFRQRKIKDPDIEEPKTWKIRSHTNGFIFQHNSLKVPEDVEKQALLSFNQSGLDFGGVDVLYNRKSRKAYIIEINCACGLQGETINVYADAFKKYATS